jgi:excisionase family DNA binding protein
VLCTLHIVTDALLSIDDLATLIQVPVKTVYNWRTEGKGPKGIKLGKHVRFRRADVEAWLDRLADES